MFLAVRFPSTSSSECLVPVEVGSMATVPEAAIAGGSIATVPVEASASLSSETYNNEMIKIGFS